MTNKTLTTPTIGSFANATHNHQNAAGGGSLDAAAIGSGTIGTARLGSGSADSTTYLRGDQTWQTISNGSSATSLAPQPVILATGSTTASLSTNTTMRVGSVNVVNSITVNTLTCQTTDFSSGGTFKVALFTYDGSTKVFEVTSASVAGDGVKNIVLSAPTAVAAGQYYVAVVGVSGAFGVSVYSTDTTTFGIVNSVSAKARFEGTVTVSAGTIPSTITPSSITSAQNNGLVFRITN